MKMVNNIRDSRIEILRCFFMFCICVLHSITQGGYCHRWIDNLMMPSVTGFVVISAWFGLSFRPSKVLRLIGVAAWCAIVVACCFQKNVVIWSLQHYWFLWAYILLMLFAPIIDSAKLSLKVVLPLLLGVFAWGCVCDLSMFSTVLPHTAGLTAYSGVTFVGIYVAVRAFKQSQFINRITTKQLIWIAGISALICECGLYRYNSPFALTLTLSLVLLVQRMPQLPRLGVIALNLSPSMFAVYMYHTGAGFNVLRSLEAYFVNTCGVPVYVTHILTALLVFWGCIVIDIPRRVLCVILRRPMSALWKWIDQSWSLLVAREI